MPPIEPYQVTKNRIYFLPPALTTAIIVLHQLPETPETLWLRLLLELLIIIVSADNNNQL